MSGRPNTRSHSRTSNQDDSSDASSALEPAVDMTELAPIAEQAASPGAGAGLAPNIGGDVNVDPPTGGDSEVNLTDSSGTAEGSPAVNPAAPSPAPAPSPMSASVTSDEMLALTRTVSAMMSNMEQLAAEVRSSRQPPQPYPYQTHAQHQQAMMQQQQAHARAAIEYEQQQAAIRAEQQRAMHTTFMPQPRLLAPASVPHSAHAAPPSMRPSSTHSSASPDSAPMPIMAQSSALGQAPMQLHQAAPPQSDAKLSVFKLEKDLPMFTKPAFCTYTKMREWATMARSVQAFGKLSDEQLVRLAFRRLETAVQHQIRPLYPANQLTPSSFEALYKCLYSCYGTKREMNVALRTLTTRQRPSQQYGDYISEHHEALLTLKSYSTAVQLYPPGSADLLIAGLLHTTLQQRLRAAWQRDPNSITIQYVYDIMESLGLSANHVPSGDHSTAAVSYASTSRVCDHCHRQGHTADRCFNNPKSASYKPALRSGGAGGGAGAGAGGGAGADEGADDGAEEAENSMVARNRPAHEYNTRSQGPARTAKTGQPVCDCCKKPGHKYSTCRRYLGLKAKDAKNKYNLIHQ